MLEQKDDNGYIKRVEKTGSTVGSNVTLDNDVWLEIRKIKATYGEEGAETCLSILIILSMGLVVH